MGGALMYVFLDDYRNPGDVTWVELPTLPEGQQWIVVRNLEEFLTVIDNHLREIKHICFDHDLGDKHYHCDYSDEKTGYDCAKILVNHCMEQELPLPDYTVHSWNRIGAENIRAYLENYKRVSGNGSH
jgi:hypothetical protein